jgi:hypothetical protein
MKIDCMQIALQQGLSIMWYFYAEHKVAAMCRFTLAWAETKVAARIILLYIFGSVWLECLPTKYCTQAAQVKVPHH